MNSKETYSFDGFKATCSGRDCPRKPRRLLRIKYVQKVGKFCETCAADLLEAGLVEEEMLSESSMGNGP
jgi:hypothetical protein